MTSREWNTAVGTGLLRVGVGAALLRWRKPLSQRLALVLLPLVSPAYQWPEREPVLVLVQAMRQPVLERAVILAS